MSTRQKKVFPRDTVAHLWAHQAQDEARDSSGNFYFTGPTIYSYGSHFAIAHILSDECGPNLAGRVLWNDATYSNTTSKMQSIALRALTRQQRETALHMPGTVGMGRNVDPRAIDRALREKRLPDVAPLLVARVVECVAALPAKKRDAGPFANLLYEARKAEKLALLMYARAGRKYPLTVIPETLPADKAEFLAWIKSYAATKMRADYAHELRQAQHYAAQARNNAADCLPGFPYFQYVPGCEWEARSIVSSTYNSAQRAVKHANDAAKIYATLHDGKTSATARKLLRELAPLVELFADRREEFTKRDGQNRVIYNTREALKMYRAAKARGELFALRFARGFRDAESLVEMARDSGMADTVYLPLAQRMARVGAAIAAHHALNDAADDMETARSYMPGAHWGDVKRYARDALRHLEYFACIEIAPGMRAYLAPRASELQAAVNDLNDVAQAAIAERDADKLRAWLAGESNARPSYEAGTYARIDEARGIVETTRGATVPIKHACRLARMYAITVRRGGQSWQDGAGPMVGHYRVNNIGPDGSLIIGCHEFSPAEARRLYDVLTSCAACAEVAD